MLLSFNFFTVTIFPSLHIYIFQNYIFIPLFFLSFPTVYSITSSFFVLFISFSFFNLLFYTFLSSYYTLSFLLHSLLSLSSCIFFCLSRKEHKNPYFFPKSPGCLELNLVAEDTLVLPGTSMSQKS